MIKDKKILIVGAGGFIGGHLAKKLLDNGNSIVSTDIKPKEYWFQDFETAENYYSMDMKDINNCRKVTKNIDYVFNMACNMGGMGFIENNNQRIIVNSEARIKKISELKKLPIINNKGDIIRVEDIASVSEGKAPSISAVSINEKDGVYLSIQGQLGSNTYKLTKQLEESLDSIEPILKKESIELIPDLFKPANFIDASIKRLRFDIIIGAIMVITILYLFLFNLKTAFISAVAIPISLLSAICVMSFYGLGLNVMVLSGLAIVLGEVVDDAIIDVENIFRRLRQKK